jgi:hypothetical protein
MGTVDHFWRFGLCGNDGRGLRARQRRAAAKAKLVVVFVFTATMRADDHVVFSLR